jgi:glycosyltransferase involved in cell wall biosynthesis
VIVAGFIFEAKGYRLVLEAMPLLPDIRVVFVGGATLGDDRSATVSELTQLAARYGVADRLRVTGYLPEDEYRRQLAGADLAVCAFTSDKCASGSLSSLIAAACPVVASDVALIREYNDLAPGAIPTFAPYTPDALARAIRRLLAQPRAELTRGLAPLRRRLSISAIYDRHLDSYRRVLRPPAGDGAR